MSGTKIHLSTYIQCNFVTLHYNRFPLSLRFCPYKKHKEMRRHPILKIMYETEVDPLKYCSAYNYRTADL